MTEVRYLLKQMEAFNQQLPLHFVHNILIINCLAASSHITLRTVPPRGLCLIDHSRP